MDPPLIVILGPTGVGKTALAIQVARPLGGEIVSADSRQVYRWMDIGTAKPTPAQRAAVPHHLVDIVAPDEDFSLAHFCDLARAALEAITARGRLPLLVGGTGQYLAAILEGWQVPRVPPQPALRARLRQEAQAQGSAALHERLQKVDPAAAAKISPNNLRRIVRALEVYEVSGAPISEQQGRHPPPYNIFCVGLTMERPELYRRVDQRAEEMVRQGLLAEIHTLLERGYGWELPAMSGLGYRQFRPYLAGECSLEEALTQLQHDTHAFIRHQYTWFRRLQVDRWFDAGRPEELDAVRPTVQTWLEGRGPGQ